MVNIEEIQIDGNRALKLVRRAEWATRSPQNPLEPFGALPAKYVIISQYNEHSRSTSIEDFCSQMRDMQSYHMIEKGFDDVAFNYAVANGGYVIEGRGHKWRAAAAKNWNSVSFGLVFMGLFEPDNELCKAAVEAAQLLFEYLIQEKRLDKDYIVYGIRQVRPFNSPTKALYDVIRSWPHWEDRVAEDGTS